MHELMDNLQQVKCVWYGRYLRPADVGILLINVLVMAGDWLDPKIVPDDLDL